MKHLFSTTGIRKALTLCAFMMLAQVSIQAAETTTWSKTSGSGTGYSWSGTTLTLTNFTWVTSASKAMTLPANTIIVLEGTNIVTSTSTGVSMSDHSYGINPSGALTIRGTGSLTATSGDITMSFTSSYGIHTMAALTIESGTVSFIGGSSTNGGSIGISCNGTTSPLTISGGTVTATSGISTGLTSIGINSHTTTISGGTVITNANTSVNSTGFYAVNLSITSGSLTSNSTKTAISVTNNPSLTVIGGDSNSDSNPLYWSSGSYTKTAGNTDYAMYAVVTAANGTVITNETEMQTAIDAFNSGSSDATITIGASFTDSHAYTINNSGKTLTIQNDGTERTITCTNAGTPFTVNNGTLVLNNITLDGNKAANGGTFSRAGALVVAHGLNTNTTQLTITNTTIRNNKNTTNATGGGVQVLGGGSFTMHSGTISGNEATGSGGGVYVGGSGTSFNMLGGTIGGLGAGNTASVSGGGVSMNNGTLNLSGDANISYNTSSDDKDSSGGGGVYLSAVWTMNMTGGTISHNTSGSNGGGIYIANPGSAKTATLSGGTISNNTATKSGGGVYMNSSNITLAMTGGEISGNSCGTGNYNGGGIYHNANALTLGGNVSITGNTKDGAANNVYLNTGKTITLSSLTGTNIGISKASGNALPYTFVATDATETIAGYFSADVSTQEVVYDNGALKLQASSGTGINDTNADSPIIRTEYYSIMGKQLNGKPAKGFYIEQNMHENGARSSRTMGAF